MPQNSVAAPSWTPAGPWDLSGAPAASRRPASGTEGPALPPEVVVRVAWSGDPDELLLEDDIAARVRPRAACNASPAGAGQVPGDLKKAPHEERDDQKDVQNERDDYSSFFCSLSFE